MEDGYSDLRTEVSPISDRERLLLLSIQAITKERNNTYGPPTADFARTASIWSLLFNHEFTSHDVAVAMIALKLSRVSWSPEHEDNWIDIAGYAACGHECVIEESK